MNILALDMATTTGWATTCGASGAWDLRIARDESSGMRLIRFRGKLRELVELARVDLIVFEAVTAAQGPKANLDGVKLGFKLQAVVEQLVEESAGLDCRSYNLKEIKQHATGKGNASKEEMVSAAEEKWPGVEIVDDNQADALWLLDLATTYQGGDPPQAARKKRRRKKA